MKVRDKIKIYLESNPGNFGMTKRIAMSVKIEMLSLVYNWSCKRIEIILEKRLGYKKEEF